MNPKNRDATAEPSDTPSDTQLFLRALFQEDSNRAWVAAFTQSPFAPSELTDKQAASKLQAAMWGGGIYRKLQRRCTDDANQYICISTFKAAPWTSHDGVEHITPKRRKSHFERACAVMVDDIGPGQKVEPSKVLLPLTATVETSPGNCQGWYALDPADADSFDPDKVALLLDRMVAAGLTKDGSDPGMKGVTRYGRLPAGVNNKPGRDPWTVKLRSLNPLRRYTVQDIAEAYGLDLTAPPPPEREASDTPAESLARRLADAGLGPVLKAPGKWDITCPWVEGHTQGIDGGSAYMEPSEDNNYVGGYRCHHGHCSGMFGGPQRGIGDLFRWLDERRGGAIENLGKLLAHARPAPAITSPVTPPFVSQRRKEFDDDELMITEHPDIPWMVDQLICPGLTLLAAPPKMGKSYFVLQMALCVGAGVPFLGRETTKTKVSYFDLEEWEELLQRRRKRIGKANGIDRAAVRYAMEMSGGDITVLHDIQRHIDEGSKLIIIDLLARVRDELVEDAKKNAYARDYAALRQFSDLVLQRNPDVAIVIVHHTNKGKHEDWQSNISGSQGLAGASHTNMLMTHIDLRGLDDEARKEALRYRRFHVVGKAADPDEMMLEMMPDGGGWQVTDKTTDEVKMQGKHAHILQVLREAGGAWTTAKEVKEVVEGTLDSIKKMLARMAKKGEIESGGQGGPGYRLA